MEPGFVKVIHPELGVGSVSEVPETGLFQYYLSGWRLLAADEEPAVPVPVVPPPVTLAEVTAAALQHPMRRSKWRPHR